MAISLADTLKAYGILPDVVAGDSLGELAAAYAASLFSLEDLLTLLVKSLQPQIATEQAAAPLPIKASQITMISSITGEPVDIAQISSRDYWVNRTASALSMEKVSRSLCAQKNITILELGQGGYLASLLKENIKEDLDQEILTPLVSRGEMSEKKQLLAIHLGYYGSRAGIFNGKRLMRNRR